MATTWRIDTTLENCNKSFGESPTYLCERFWDTIDLKSESFNDHLSMYCNNDYAFSENRGRHVSDHTRHSPYHGFDRPHRSDKLSTTQSKSAYLGQSRAGTSMLVSSPSSPTVRSTAAGTLRSTQHNQLRPDSPMRSNLLQPSPRPFSPALSLLTFAPLYLNTLISPTQALQNTPLTAILCSREEDFTIFESDVVINVIEDTDQAQLWDAASPSEDHSFDGVDNMLLSALASLDTESRTAAPHSDLWSAMYEEGLGSRPAVVECMS